MKREITVHKQIGASLKLFLDELGYKSVWGFVDEDHDLLTVLEPEDLKFIMLVFNEVKVSGFIPYHYSIPKFKLKGKKHKDEKVHIEATVISKQIFRNVSGDFMLVSLDTEDTHYLWKSYKLDRDIEVGDKLCITGKFVITLRGINNENINLINFVRIKDESKNCF